MPRPYRCCLELAVGVGFGGKSERNKSLTGSVFFCGSGRGRRFFGRCSFSARLGFGLAVRCGVVVAAPTVGSGVMVSGPAMSSGVAVANSTGVGVATIGAVTVAGKVS